MPPSAEAARADEATKNLNWDLFRWGTLSLGIVLSGSAVSALTLAGSSKVRRFAHPRTRKLQASVRRWGSIGRLSVAIVCGVGGRFGGRGFWLSLALSLSLRWRRSFAAVGVPGTGVATVSMAQVGHCTRHGSQGTGCALLTVRPSALRAGCLRKRARAFPLPSRLPRRVGTSTAVLAAVAFLCLLTYGLYYVRLPVSDRAHKELRLPFTRSRMVSRAGLCFCGTALNAAVWTTIVIVVAAVVAEAGLSTKGEEAASFLQRAAQTPKGGSAAKPAEPAAKPQDAAGPTPLWPEEGGPIGAAGACGDSLLGGAMIAAEGFAGIADATGLFFCAVMLLPVLCPLCRDVRCGNSRPVTVRLPLFLAPAGLIYPPELRDELAAVLDTSAKASFSGPGSATCVSGKAVPDSLGAAVAERLHNASLDPWREVEVESWYRVQADGMPVDAHETRIRDAFLARVATLPWSSGALADTSAPAWAAALPEAAALSPAARAAFLAAMASVFGASAVAESPTDDTTELADATGDTEEERQAKQPRLPVFLRDWDPEASYR